jgi:hypothetical protein
MSLNVALRAPSPLYWFLAHSDEPFPVSRNLGGVVGRWIYDTWIYSIIMSVVLGALIGHIARKTLRFCEKKNWMDGKSFVELLSTSAHPSIE